MIHHARATRRRPQEHRSVGVLTEVAQHGRVVLNDDGEVAGVALRDDPRNDAEHQSLGLVCSTELPQRARHVALRDRRRPLVTGLQRDHEPCPLMLESELRRPLIGSQSGEVEEGARVDPVVGVPAFKCLLVVAQSRVGMSQHVAGDSAEVQRMRDETL